MEATKQETRSKTMHMGMSIKGCLDRYKRKKINFFTNDDGSQCSDREAREYLKECLEKGWDSFPMCGSEECPDFDHFGKGCPGHYVSNEFEGTKWNNQWARKMWELDLKTLEATFSMTADGLGKIEFVDKIRERLASESK